LDRGPVLGCTGVVHGDRDGNSPIALRIGHFYTAGIFNINKDFYESLEGQDKEWFDEASEHFVQNLTQLIRDAQEGYIQLLKDNGINVVEVTSEQKDAFIESAASVYDLFIEKYGGTQELIDLAMKYNDDF